MRIFSFVAKRFEDGSFSGVARFDHELRKVFPDLISVTEPPGDLVSDDIVITDNHLSLFVPEEIKTIVVHHGCAKTHYDRDPAWRTDQAAAMAERQGRMFGLKNRFFVAPSEWARDQFAAHYNLGPNHAIVIPHWVPLIQRKPIEPLSRRPVVLGDWRDANKGAGVIEALKKRSPELQFRQLQCTYDTRAAAYKDADAYLCLSVSEGGSYSMSDAEAAALQIVTTNVGNHYEYPVFHALPWKRREELDTLVYYLHQAVRIPRAEPSFFGAYSFAKWSDDWKDLLDRVATGQNVKKIRRPPPRVKQGETILIGTGSGVGNVLFNLPLIKAAHELTGSVNVYSRCDYSIYKLLTRCKWIDRVYAYPDRPPSAELALAGPTCPSEILARENLVRIDWAQPGQYEKPEWQMCLDAARAVGWQGPEFPDVSDWCDYLEPDSDKCWDVGIAPGGKPDPIWLRKRYPGMVKTARILSESGIESAWFGLEEDRPEGDEQLPGDDLFGKVKLHKLPDLLMRCRLILGTDSGITQLAASLGIPTIMLFTATSMIKGDPVGQNVIKIARDIPCRPCVSTPSYHACSNWICRDLDPKKLADRVAEALYSHGPFLNEKHEEFHRNRRDLLVP